MTREQVLAWANEVEKMGALGNIARVNEITSALGGVTIPPGWYPNEFYAIAAGIREKAKDAPPEAARDDGEGGEGG